MVSSPHGQDDLHLVVLHQGEVVTTSETGMPSSVRHPSSPTWVNPMKRKPGFRLSARFPDHLHGVLIAPHDQRVEREIAAVHPPAVRVVCGSRTARTDATWAP